MNELLHSQWHSDQANRQIAERHVDNEEIASGPGLGVADDHVTNAAVAQNAQYNEQSENKQRMKQTSFFKAFYAAHIHKPLLFTLLYKGQSELQQKAFVCH